MRADVNVCRLRKWLPSYNLRDEKPDAWPAAVQWNTRFFCHWNLREIRLFPKDLHLSLTLYFNSNLLCAIYRTFAWSDKARLLALLIVVVHSANRILNKCPKHSEHLGMETNKSLCCQIHKYKTSNMNVVLHHFDGIPFWIYFFFRKIENQTSE